MKKSIKKHRAIIQSSNNITAQQRKAFNVLLYFAKEQLEKNPQRNSFTCDELSLRKLISSGQRITTDEIKKSLRELMDIKLEFNILEDDKFKSWRIMTLISEVDINSDGTVEYNFPPTLRTNILTPEIFCPLDLEILAVLSSKFSIAIYEFCKDYIKVEMPKLEIDTFKKMMGIQDKYDRMYDLKLYVLSPAIKEISEKTDLKLGYDLITLGRKITHIKFKAEKKEKSEKIEKSGNNSEFSETEFLTEIITLIPEYEILTNKETSELKELTAKHGKEIVISNIRYTNRQNYQNYYVYLRKAITEDYAEKDRKINEMKAEERKAYEQKVKDEEAAAGQRELQRKQAIRIYQTLPDAEREAIETEAEKALETVEGIDNVRHIKIVYENMKLSKIVELITTKYLNK